MLTEKTVDRDSQEKLYVQIYSIIRRKILDGEWPMGAQIPTEDELCAKFEVSKVTVRMAIAELVRNGYLRKQQGKGTFVTETVPELGITMKTRLTENMFGEGVKVKREVLVRGIKDPPDDVKACLKAKESVYYILCKRVVDGEPAYLEESFIPVASMPGIEEEDLCQSSLYDLIQGNAVKKIHKVIQTIEITRIQGDAAAILKTGAGTPGLLFHRLLIAPDGSPIAYIRLTGTGSKYKLQTELVKIS